MWSCRGWRKRRSWNLISNLYLHRPVAVPSLQNKDGAVWRCTPMLNEQNLEVKWAYRSSFYFVFPFFFFCWTSFLPYQSDAHGRWRFKDGVFVEDELGTVDLENIRAACSRQSRSHWTAIASRDRLYQFMSMSDEETQTEMRREVSRMNGVEELGTPSGSKR